MNRLVIRGVRKRFGPRVVLDGVDLSVKESEILAVIGRSGAGKTTLLRIVAGLERPDEGEVIIGGRLATSGPEILVPPYERGTGFIFQNLGLWEHMSVERHIKFVLRARGKTPESTAVSKYLDAVGLGGMRKRMPSSLSGGERQRLAIARTLAQEPLLLLLDEPFSNLDLPRKRALQTELLKIRKRRRLSMVYVTHDPVDVRLLSDTVAVLHEGKIVQKGSYEELMTAPVNAIVSELLTISTASEKI